MSPRIIFLSAFFIFICEIKAQPYNGTIFIESNIINAQDPTTFKSSTYKGQANRVVYDRRTANWETINAYLFEIIWSDGLKTEAQINPEFGSINTAGSEAEKYGKLVGQLPNCLRKDVDALWIHKGVQPFGGGNRSILIHTGQSSLYEGQGILEETLVHEASHTSLDAQHAASVGWINSQNKDNLFISTYARDNPTREDIAESFLLWLAVRHKSDRISVQNLNIIKQSIPNRLKYFDEQMLNVFPLANHTSSTNDEILDVFFEITSFPNPFSSQLAIDLEVKKEDFFTIEIINMYGVIVETIIQNKLLSPSSFHFIWNLNKTNDYISEDNLYFVVIKRANKVLGVQKVLSVK